MNIGFALRRNEGVNLPDFKAELHFHVKNHTTHHLHTKQRIGDREISVLISISEYSHLDYKVLVHFERLLVIYVAFAKELWEKKWSNNLDLLKERFYSCGQKLCNFLEQKKDFTQERKFSKKKEKASTPTSQMAVISLQATSFPGKYTVDKPGIQSKIPPNRRYIARIFQIRQSEIAR